MVGNKVSWNKGEILLGIFFEADRSTSYNSIFPFATHIPSPGASTAWEKGSVGPVQKRRKYEALGEIGRKGRHVLWRKV